MKQELLDWGWVGALGLLASSVVGCTRDPWPLPEVPAGSESTASDGQGRSAAPHLDWSYQGADGPESWAKLNPKWAACAEPGQSPVDLPLDGLGAAAPGASTPGEQPAKDPKAAPVEASPLDFLQGTELTAQFADLPLEATNDGRLFSLAGASSQGLSIGGKLAVLQSIEFHLPAEHRLGGTPVDLELVLWLKHPEHGRIAFSLLFRSGQANGVIGRLVEHLPLEGTYEKKLLNAAIPLPDLLAGDGSLLGYLGSESTPPCQASIPRLVLARVGELSPEQLSRLTEALPARSGRPVQPLGDRKVQILSLSSVPSSSSSEKKP